MTFSACFAGAVLYYVWRKEVVMSRIGETLNEYGTPVAKYRCESCGEVFSVCPSPTPDEDEQWRGCLWDGCDSYDESRDIDNWFDEGRVRAIPMGDGKSRLVPLKVIDGGRNN